MPDTRTAPDRADQPRDGETVEEFEARWNAEHPPLPGLRWRIYWGTRGGQLEVRGHHLEVVPGWEDAFAPPASNHPTTAAKHAVRTRPEEADRLGALAYRGFMGAAPEPVRGGRCPWDQLPEAFRECLRQAAVIVWQHGENAGFHEALLRTLPSGRLGAAGELENMLDLITAIAVSETPTRLDRKPIPVEQLTVSIAWLRQQIVERIAELRRQANAEARRERDAGRRR